MLLDAYELSIGMVRLSNSSSIFDDTFAKLMLPKDVTSRWLSQRRSSKVKQNIVELYFSYWLRTFGPTLPLGMNELLTSEQAQTNTVLGEDH
ncbi:hypothetical protein CA13_60470 [Planctomycetes bacterium CA13]|uniref:Uncharacterized protein n=1 Tax=Novipirellula herctigrandis TaxID=2527986 RepID=A0A5C5ZBQ2_9BACT|nr:hypothetical protein CA13_60470 [Planctomycetes bacterium CA13]